MVQPTKLKKMIFPVTLVMSLGYLIIRLFLDGGVPGDCTSSLSLRRSYDLGGDWGWACKVSKDQASFLESVTYWFTSNGLPDSPWPLLLTGMIVSCLVSVIIFKDSKRRMFHYTSLFLMSLVVCWIWLLNFSIQFF